MALTRPIANCSLPFGGLIRTWAGKVNSWLGREPCPVDPAAPSPPELLDGAITFQALKLAGWTDDPAVAEPTAEGLDILPE